MDQITNSLLKEYVAARQLDDLKEDSQFEHFASFITLRRHHARTFETDDIVVGSGGDTSIDSIAIIVNGTLVTEAVTIDEMAEGGGTLDVNFVFVQADRGSQFEGAKMASFGFGVGDFFQKVPKLVRNQHVKDMAEVWSAILDHVTQLKAKPSCRLYYVTTGKWTDDENNVARRDGVIADLEGTQLFSSVEFNCYGANEIHKFYTQTKTAITRSFHFKEKAELPKATGVIRAYIGYVPAAEFLKVISDDSGDDILGSIFDDNVRDWQDYNQVNKEMRATLESAAPERFVMMNNGITILTRKIGGVGSDLILEDFQIVNGCQTSHVLFNQRKSDLSAVAVPVRLIETQDDEVKEAVIKATNRQTELKPEQLYALTDFSRQLEQHFSAFDELHRLFYERRDCQYDRFPDVGKARIVTPQSLIRSFGAMFLNEPTRVTRNYKTIRHLVGKQIFKEGDRLEPYYVAAYAAYRLDFLLRNRLDKDNKAARYHILTALRYLLDPDPLPHMNSHKMGQRCDEMRAILWDQQKLDFLVAKAAKIVRDLVKANGETFERDNIRTEATTTALLKHFGVKHAHAAE